MSSLGKRTRNPEDFTDSDISSTKRAKHDSTTMEPVTSSNTLESSQQQQAQRELVMHLVKGMEKALRTFSKNHDIFSICNDPILTIRQLEDKIKKRQWRRTRAVRALYKRIDANDEKIMAIKDYYQQCKIQLYRNLSTCTNGTLNRLFGMLYLYEQNTQCNPEHDELELRNHLHDEFAQVCERYMAPWVCHTLNTITGIYLWHRCNPVTIKSSSALPNAELLHAASHLLPTEIWSHILDYTPHMDKNIMYTCKFFFVCAHRSMLSDKMCDNIITHWLPQDSHQSHDFSMSNWSRMVRHAMLLYVSTLPCLEQDQQNASSLCDSVVYTTSSIKDVYCWDRAYAYISTKLQPYVYQYQHLYFNYLCAHDYLFKLGKYDGNMFHALEHEIMTRTMLPTCQIRIGFFVEDNYCPKHRFLTSMMRSFEHRMQQHGTQPLYMEVDTQKEQQQETLVYGSSVALTMHQTSNSKHLDRFSPCSVYYIGQCIREVTISACYERVLPVHMPTIKHQVDTMTLHGPCSLFHYLEHDWPQVHTLYIYLYHARDLYLVLHDCHRDEIVHHVLALSMDTHVDRLMHLFPILQHVIIVPQKDFMWVGAIHKERIDVLLTAWKSKANIKLSIK